MILELCISLSLAWLILNYLSKPKPKHNLPGPLGLPLVGHLAHLGGNPNAQFLKWKQIHGPIYFIRFGSFPTVVINDAKLIKEAFNLPALSGRAQLDCFMEGSEGKGIGMSEGRDNTEQRQFVLKTLKRLGGNVEGSIQEEIKDLLNYLHDQSKTGEPLLVKHLFSTFVVNTLWNIIMGHRFERQDPKIPKLIAMLDGMTKMDSIIKQMAIFMPWVGKFVGSYSGYEETVRDWQTIKSYMKEQIADKKRSWVKGQPRHFTDAYLDKIEEAEDVHSSFHTSRNFQPQLTTDLFGAGMETVVTSLEWLVYYLAQHPQVQIKMQQEIDLIVGTSRLPSLADRGQMIYCEAVILESARLASVVPLGVFHRAITDVNFRGYQIPKDTIVISDLYSIHHDPNIWADPDTFRPERFIQNGVITNSDALLLFSAGRRACVGEQTAKDQLFLYATSICQSFNIKFPPKVPTVRGTFGMTLAPSKFHVTLKERTF